MRRLRQPARLDGFVPRFSDQQTRRTLRANSRGNGGAIIGDYPVPNMELTLSSLKRDFAKETIGKERAALFRHYRVVARKQRSEVLFARVKRGSTNSVPLFTDNGR